MNSIVVSKDFLPCDVFPSPVMKWSGDIYKRVFGSTFDTHQNDYIRRLSTEDDTLFRKVAGNAQSFSKNRCVHHTSFLLTVNQTAMEKYLTNPKRQPAYRAGRSHTSFLEGVVDAFPSAVGGKSKDEIQELILNEMKTEAAMRDYEVEPVEWNNDTIQFLKDIITGYIDGNLPGARGMRSTRYIDKDNVMQPDLFDGLLWKTVL